MLCAIWYHVHKLKYVKNTHGVVLLLVKLQALLEEGLGWLQKRGLKHIDSENFTKINTPPWFFFKFLKLYKWYQIVQRITIIL